MNKVQAACGFLMIATVSACGSSNSNGGGGTVDGGTLTFPTPLAESATDAETVALANAVLANFALLDAAINADLVAAPTTAPTAEATFDGYIGLELADEKYIAGYLEIDLDFSDSSGTSTAGGFIELTFDGEDVDAVATTLGLTGGDDELSGSVTIIDGTTITSTLDGMLASTVTPLLANLDLAGNLYQFDEGQYEIDGDLYQIDGDLLVITGGVTGTVGGDPVASDSEFVAIEVFD